MDGTQPVRRRYRVLDRLGQGGLGSVYRAEMSGQGGFRRLVALKFVQEGIEREEEMKARLRDEARILGRIRHEAVIDVISLAHVERGWAVVMEYVEGVDAAQLCKLGPLPPRVAADVLTDVASVLHAAWSQTDTSGAPLRILHRDIKPHNIVVDRRGRVKVLDFGAASAQGMEREAKTRSVMLGTQRYLAPERYQGQDGPEGDIYSLGVTFAELLMGKPLLPEFFSGPGFPSRRGSLGDRVRDHLRHSLVATHPTLAADKANQLAQLVSELMHYHPEHRPLAADVERRGRLISDQLGGPGLRSWALDVIPELVRQREASFAKDELCGSTLVEVPEITGGFDTRGMPRPVTPPVPPEPPSERSLGLMVVLGGVLGLLVLSCAGASTWAVLANLSASPPPAPVPEVAPPTPEPEPEPEPTPEPAPPTEEPRPPKRRDLTPVEPTPAPAPPPEPPPPAHTVRLQGDVPQTLTLDGASTHRIRSGSPVPPPGRYKVLVQYDGGPTEKAGEISIPKGRSLSILCRRSIPRCVLR